MMQQHRINLPAASYPRTGKRGVPQQFPRRLYEMLETESSEAAQARAQVAAWATNSGYLSGATAATANDIPLISWSGTGRAFRIVDVKLFAETVLPKYFRTAKFSSFQRNLNLYGFCKVRKGPDTDMYAHPSFLRGHPEKLILLRKLTTTADRRRATGKRGQKIEEAGEQGGGNGKTVTSTHSGTTGTASPPMSMQFTGVANVISKSPPQRMGSLGVVTDCTSSSNSCGASICSATSTDAEQVARTTYNISIPKLIATYQKSVDIQPAECIKNNNGSSRNCDNHNSSNGHSSDSFEGNNKLAILALAMTSIAGQEAPSTANTQYRDEEKCHPLN